MIGRMIIPAAAPGNRIRAIGAPLASQSGMEAVNIRLFEDGRYELEFTVKPTDDAMRDRLIAAGFLLTNRGYALKASGSF